MFNYLGLYRDSTHEQKSAFFLHLPQTTTGAAPPVKQNLAVAADSKHSNVSPFLPQL